MTDMATEIAEAWREADQGEAELGLDRLQRLVAQDPQSALANFELAGFLDWLGREQEAVAPYETAATLGLPDDLQAQWSVQYGSTLRNVGRQREAIDVLRRGMVDYADYPAIDLMLVLALLDLGETDVAATTALRAALKPDEAGSIKRYRRALGAYADSIVTAGPKCGDESIRHP